MRHPWFVNIRWICICVFRLDGSAVIFFLHQMCHPRFVYLRWVCFGLFTSDECAWVCLHQMSLPVFVRFCLHQMSLVGFVYIWCFFLGLFTWDASAWMLCRQVCIGVFTSDESALGVNLLAYEELRQNISSLADNTIEWPTLTICKWEFLWHILRKCCLRIFPYDSS